MISASDTLDWWHIKQWFPFQFFTVGDMKPVINIETKKLPQQIFSKAGSIIQVLTQSKRRNSKPINSLEKWNGGTLIFVCDVPSLHLDICFVSIFEASWILFRLRQMPCMPWYFWLIYPEVWFALTSLQVSRLS